MVTVLKSTVNLPTCNFDIVQTTGTDAGTFGTLG